MERHRILVYRAGALGDTLLIAFVLSALRSDDAGAHITLACNISYGAVLKDAGLCDALLSVDSTFWSALFSESEDGRLPGAFDEAVVFTAGGDSTFAHNLKRLIPVVRCGNTNPLPGRHIVSRLTEVLNDVEVSTMPQHLVLRFPNAQARAARYCAGPGPGLLAVHPGAGSKLKRWHAECFREIIRRWCASSGNSAAIVCGPADDDFDTTGFSRSQVVVLKNIPPADLGCVLVQAGRFLGNDSGIAHLAALCGTESVVLFGATDPIVWAPRGPNVKVLQSFTAGDGHPNMDVASVWAAIAR